VGNAAVRAGDAGRVEGWTVDLEVREFGAEHVDGGEVEAGADFADQDEFAARLGVRTTVEGADPAGPIAFARMPATQDDVAGLHRLDLDPVRTATPRQITRLPALRDHPFEPGGRRKLQCRVGVVVRRWCLPERV